jgi:hypothetical protein
MRGRLPCEPDRSANSRRRLFRMKGAEDLDSRENSIASDDSEHMSRHLEKFLTSVCFFCRFVTTMWFSQSFFFALYKCYYSLADLILVTL